jgi:type IV pilus assembly protein PilO
MVATKKWSAGAVGISLLLLVASWFLLLSPQRSDTSALKEQKVSQDQTNEATRSDIALLRAQAIQLPAQRAIIAGFHERVPDDAQLPALVRSLTDLATKADVELQSIVPALPLPLSAGSTTTVPGAAPATSSLNSLGVVLTVKGDYFAVEAFLGQLESLKRLFLVTSLDVTADAGAPTAGGTPSQSNGSVTATVNGRVFTTSPAPVAAPAAAAAQPTSAPAADAAAATAN